MSSIDVSVIDAPAADVPASDVPAFDVPAFDVPPPLLRSCADHLRAGHTTSGPYAIDPDGDRSTAAVTVFCDQVRDGGGWQRVLDLLDGVGCPPVLTVNAGERACVRRFGPGETVSVFRVTPEVPFSEVRGRAAFRGRGDLDAFDNRVDGLGADGVFVDGLTVSRVLPGGGDGGDGGAGREHVFTWAITESEPALRATSACPCAGGREAPSWVGERYLCRGLINRSRDAGAPVDVSAWREPESRWLGPSSPCAAGDVDGWFRTTLTASFSAPLDVRLILSGTSSAGAVSEDIGIAALELYVR